jgi:hypothetical protein
MRYEAMEWDHMVDHTMIRWVVMECAGVVIKAGAVQALAPRRDVAYFVDASTAEPAAKEFARLKNLQTLAEDAASEWRRPEAQEFVAYPWDHLAGRDFIRWGVLRWSQEDPGKRTDVAYLLDEQTAEQDAMALQRAMGGTQQ